MGCTEIFLAQAPSIIIAFLEPPYVKNTECLKEKEKECVFVHTHLLPRGNWLVQLPQGQKHNSKP